MLGVKEVYYGICASREFNNCFIMHTKQESAQETKHSTSTLTCKQFYSYTCNLKDSTKIIQKPLLKHILKLEIIVMTDMTTTSFIKKLGHNKRVSRVCITVVCKVT